MIAKQIRHCNFEECLDIKIINENSLKCDKPDLPYPVPVNEGNPCKYNRPPLNKIGYEHEQF